MTDWLTLLAFGLIGAMFTLTALGLGVAAIMPSTNRWNRRFFISLFATIMLLILSVLVDSLVWENPTMAAAEKIAAFFEYLLFSLPMPMFTIYLLKTCGERWQTSSLFRTTAVLWGLFFILLSSAQGTTYLYYITPDNQFYRGHWHSLLMAPLIIIMLLNLAGVIRRRRQLPTKYYAAFLVNLLPLTIALLPYTFFPFSLTNEMVLFIGEVLSTLSMFGMILYHQTDQYMHQQREIAHQRASIMVLQMRPHFIYNAMMSIYYLCASDAQKAQQVTLDFTTYLRKNFTAIAGENTIPFADELEHARAYLAIEQVQFEDRLCVEYDTPHTCFRLPPLTLQPIVENAVKHGLDPEAAPLHITIRTIAANNGSQLIVEDNGPGFDLAELADSPEPHIALTNIQQRLKLMCGGEMKIRPRAEGGTIVTITIP